MSDTTIVIPAPEPEVIIETVEVPAEPIVSEQVQTAQIQAEAAVAIAEVQAAAAVQQTEIVSTSAESISRMELMEARLLALETAAITQSTAQPEDVVEVTPEPQEDVEAKIPENPRKKAWWKF